MTSSLLTLPFFSYLKNAEDWSTGITKHIFLVPDLYSVWPFISVEHTEFVCVEHSSLVSFVRIKYCVSVLET